MKKQQTIFKNEHHDQFTVISNATIRDNSLSLKARGLHHYLLSLPKSWEVNIRHLANEFEKDGRSAIASALEELIQAGYVTKEQRREDATGHFGLILYRVYETPPATESRKPEHGEAPQSGFPLTVKPLTVKPLTENRIHIKEIPLDNKESKEVKKEEKEPLLFSEERNQPEEVRSLFTDGSQKREALEPDNNPKSATGTSGRVTVGVVKYQQQPETIDMAEQWSVNPGMVKERLKYIASGHRYPVLVAHGLGELWVGPKYKDFSPQAVAIAQKRKRDLQQRDDRGAGIGYIENLIKGEKWAALESLLDESKCSAGSLVESRREVHQEWRLLLLTQ